MKSIAARIHQFVFDESGPTAVEYAVMVALIAGAIIASVGQMTNATKDSFNSSGAAINAAMSP
jgi:pilus assembly protein Flp/PilA